MEENQPSEVGKVIKGTFLKSIKFIFFIIIAIIVFMIILTECLRIVYKDDTADKAFKNDKDAYEELAEGDD